MAARDDVTTAPRPPLAYRLTARQWLGIDVAAAVIATGIALFNVGLMHHGFRYHLPTAVAATAAVAGIAPVAVRRMWPLPVLAVVTAACCVLTAYGHMRNLVYLALGMAIYTAASRCRRPAAIAVLAIVEVALGAGVLAAFALAHHTQLDPARGPLVAGALWFIGDSVRERRRYLAGLAEQEAQRRRAEAERGRQAVREERVRIARELHDVVAHSLSVVTVQAGVGRKVGSARPAEALRALRAVEVTGRGTLEELRRILGLLRDDDAERVSLAPAPGLGDLGELADSVRAAGIPVGLAVTADPAALPPAAALTVYRIVQEALTNVVKHARRAEAWVRVRADEGGVRVTVTDNGHGAGADADGSDPGPADRHGIVGMRERATAFGGTLDAGPRPEGGFQVTAFLPARAPGAAEPAAAETDAAVGQTA
jgi:signal transduction histidine kinase